MYIYLQQNKKHFVKQAVTKIQLNFHFTTVLFLQTATSPIYIYSCLAPSLTRAPRRVAQYIPTTTARRFSLLKEDQRAVVYDTCARTISISFCLILSRTRSFVPREGVEKERLRVCTHCARYIVA